MVRKPYSFLTYQKNVKYKWDNNDFKEHKVEVGSNEVTMELCEKNIKLDNVDFREDREKNSDSHQTNIITTNKKITTILIAIEMFSRWAQENSFKYMRTDYDLDRITHYIINEIDRDFEVVNPAHSKLN